MTKPVPRRDASPSADARDRETLPRVCPEQRTLFDWESAELPVSKRVTALDRRFVIEALRDIYRLSSEPHIRRIADDVLFAHRIPTEEEARS
jgi:hypothetical protein